MLRNIVFSVLIGLSSITSFAEVRTLDENRWFAKDLASDNHRPGHSYKRARKYIMQELDLREDLQGFYVQDVYCHVKYRNKVGPRKMPNHTDINVEHTWPRSRFGGKGTSKYRIQEADLHHLFPSDSKANSTRGNFIFTEFNSMNKRDSYVLNDCPSSKFGYSSSIGGNAFEPPNDHKGNVARALFYFAVRYDMKISEDEEMFLRQWHTMDPVDATEMARNDAIEDIQGNRNPFVDDPSLVNQIQDF